MPGARGRRSRRWQTHLVVAAGLLAATTITLGEARAAEDSDACPDGAVPRSWFADATGAHGSSIDCVVWHGLAHGDTAFAFRPASPVHRGQMASFLARLVAAAGVALPEPADQGFTDVDGSVHAAAINQLARLGVVRGTSATTFEPGRVVRRDQMASFLVRTVELVEGHPLPEGASPFPDVEGTAHAENVGKAHAAGLVRGTSETTFSPSAQVRRGQMASFLARTLDHLDVAAPSPTPGPRLVVGPGVTPADERTARDGMEQAITLVARLTGYATRDVDVFVFADGETLGEALCTYLDESPSSPTCEHFRQAARDQIGGGDVGFVFTRTDGWPETFGGGTAIMIHEYVQALIDELIGDVPRDPSYDDVPAIGPRWLLEGFPTYMRFLVQFPDELETLVQGAWDGLNQSPEPPKLPVTPRDIDEASHHDIDLMLVAVDVLLTDFDATPADFLAYYERIGGGDGWQDAFVASFGTTPVEFEAHLGRRVTIHSSTD